MRGIPACGHDVSMEKHGLIMGSSWTHRGSIPYLRSTCRLAGDGLDLILFTRLRPTADVFEAKIMFN